MAFEFALPDLGEGVAEAEIERWLVNEGDEVTEDQPMVEVMTDKATVEIPSPAAGKVLKVCVAAGSVVPVGTVLVEIDAPGMTQTARRPVNEQRKEGASGGRSTADMSPAEAAKRGVEVARGRTPGTPGPAANGRVKATPLVRRIARELGVDLASGTASGPGGKVTEDDVRTAATSAGNGSPAAPAAASIAAAGPAEWAVIPRGELPPGLTDAPVAERIAARGMRRAIATHLAHAGAIPTVTVIDEADLSAVNAHRADSGIGFAAYIAAATVAGLRAHPELNAIYTGSAADGEVIRFDRIDLGVAVQTDDGLVVPVLRDAGALSLSELDAGIAGLADRTRAGNLTPEDTRGGTFTVTSAGRLGGVLTTPLLNAPQIAILGLHRVIERPVAVDGAVEIRPMAHLSTTFDHRAVDGLVVSAFLLEVAAALGDPTKLTTM